jgi:hypothetical protein
MEKQEAEEEKNQQFLSKKKSIESVMEQKKKHV